MLYPNEPWRNRRFKVRGICKIDVLNPCWDDRPTDKPGQHWGGGPACEPCTKAAAEKDARGNAHVNAVIQPILDAFMPRIK